MKIATLKQECSEGDKATITGTVTWIGKVESHEGKEGEFRTQSLLLVDGPKTNDKQNSIFCGFYADKGNWNHLKGKEITAQGMINLYNGEMSLRGCKVKATPQQAQQGSSQARRDDKEEKVDWDAKDLRMARMCGLNNATQLMCLLAEMTKNNKINENTIKVVAAEYVDYIYNGLESDIDKANPEPEEPDFVKDGYIPEDDNIR